MVLLEVQVPRYPHSSRHLLSTASVVSLPGRIPRPQTPFLIIPAGGADSQINVARGTKTPFRPGGHPRRPVACWRSNQIRFQAY